MKLTQFAIAAIVVLLAAAVYLTIKSDLDSRFDAQNALNEKLVAKMEEMNHKQAAAPVAVPPAAPVAPASAVSAAPVPQVPRPPMDPKAAEALAAARNIAQNDSNLAPDNDPRLSAPAPDTMLEDERKILNTGSPDRAAMETLNAPASVDGQALSAVQRRIVALPAIAQIKQFVENEGLLVLDKGSLVAKIQPGDSFAIRRDRAVIGRVVITNTVEPTQSVAEVVANSMPVGMTPKVGDEIIQFDQAAPANN